MHMFQSIFLGALLVIGTVAMATNNTSVSRNAMIHPPRMPTDVTIGAYLVAVKTIEAPSVERPQFTAELELSFEWLDERLRGSLKKEELVAIYQDEDARSKLNQIFNPDLTTIDGEMQTLNEQLTIGRDGSVKHIQTVLVKVPNNFDLIQFPFDQQTFKIRLGSAFWSKSQLDLSIDLSQTGMSSTAAPVSWHFAYDSYKIATIKKGENQVDFASFEFLVNGKRDPRYYIWRLILPLMIIVVLSWHVFWMQTEKDEALSRCFVLLLTVVAFHQIASQALPKIPFITFIDVLVFLSYIYIIIPSFEVIVLSRLKGAKAITWARQVSHAARWLVPVSFLASIVISTLAYFS